MRKTALSLRSDYYHFPFQVFIKACFVFIAVLAANAVFSQTPYNYTTEGFDDAIFPTAAPGVETAYTSPTGTWRIFKANTVTGTDPCPNNGTNKALRMGNGNSAYLITPTLPQGCGVITFNDNRTNRTFTYYISTNDGVTWSGGTTQASGGTACGTITININNATVNKVKIANLQSQDAGIDNFLITAVSTNPPTVSTTVANGITFTTANSGGNVTADGGAPVTARGVVWNTAPNPTIANSLTSNGSGVGTFASNLTGLVASTTYYYRAYATNSVGTGYGQEYSFTTPAPTPTLIATPASLSFGGQQTGTTSTPQSYSLTGFYLSPAAGNIVITAPAGYSVSLTSSGGYATTLTIPYTGSALSATTIFIRFAPPIVGAYNGNVTNSGGTAPAANVGVTGVGNAQMSSTTNVGTEFWTGFGYQEKMSQKAGVSAEAKMSVYLSATGSIPATVIVELPGIPGAAGFPKTVTVTPGVVTEVTGFPTGDASSQYNPGNFPDTRLYYTGVSKRGVHITSTNGVPVSAWIHTYADNNSAAGAMLFPTNTWASAYTVQAYGGYSNNSNPNSYFFIIAKEDNTPIWFTPSQDVLDSIGGSSGTLFTDNHTTSQVKYQKNVEYGPIILNKGQVFNAMGFITGDGSGITAGKAFGLDLSGSKVRTNCDKQIAVFGGNGRCLVNAAGCSANSGSDHMIQQMFPDVAWGKRYMTVPTKTMEYNIYRISVTDPATQVWVNNPSHTTPLTGLVNNLYYEIASNQPQLIESDKPVSVTQFIVAGGCANQNGSKGAGDPEMIILSPAVQGITATTVYSATIKTGASYTGHYLNVVIKSTGVASFRLDGAATADPGIDQSTATAATAYNTGGAQAISSIFKPHPQDATYSYATFRVTSGASHTMTSDSTFNAIAYGMGDGESYGYNAGSALKDLSQVLLIKNPYGQATALTCKNNPFNFRIALPYAPAQLTQLTWDFDLNPYLSPNTPYTQTTPTSDSSFSVDGTLYYVYSIPSPYTFSQAGTYPFKVLANALTTGGCSGTKIFNNSITVVNGPKAAFAPQIGVCGNLSIAFTNNSTSDSTLVTTYNWDFGNTASLADTSHLQSPVYTYPSRTIYNVTLRAINASGCFNDSTAIVDLSGTLNADFTVAPADSICAGETITVTNQSTSTGTYGTITQWKWNFGDGTPDVTVTTGANQTHTYTTAGTYWITLQVLTSNSCVSTIDSFKLFVGVVPAINSAPSATICNNTAQNYQLTSSVAVTQYNWSRPAVSGISNAAASNQTSSAITETLVNTTAAPINVAYTITPKAGRCPGTAFTYTVTVNPTAIITSTTMATICNGTAQNYAITGSVSGTTFTWSRAAITGISNAAVTGQTSATITETLTNTTNTPVNVTYLITPSANGCPGTPFNYVVTVNPTPNINSASSATVCNNAALNYQITSAVSGASYQWTRPAVTGVSNPGTIGNQTANPITETLMNTTNVPVVVTYFITATANNCTAPVFSYAVTVNPSPTVTSAASGSACSGAAQNYSITANVTGTTFTWSRPAVAGISNSAVSNQTSASITEALVNTTAAPINVTYTIIPRANGCNGSAFNYVVTVNPTPAITSAATGGVCSGQPVSYNIPSNVTGATFTWGRAAVAGISNTALIGQTANPISETLVNTTTNTLTVVYSIVANFGGCSSAPFTYSVTVTPAPTVTNASSGTVCNNTAQNYQIISTVTGTAFNWSRASVAGISNAAASNQTSSTIAEALVNTTITPVNVTYAIATSANGCPGATFNYVVTVYPTASITSAATGSVCSGATQNYTVTSNVTGAIFSWSRAAVAGISNAAVNGQTSGTISEALTNTTNTAVNVTYVITPTANGCAGTPFNYVVSVKPSVSITSAISGTVCSGAAQNYAIIANVSGTTFSWSRAAVTGISNAGVGGQTSGTITEALTNTTSSPITVQYVIVATANSCPATPFTYSVTVNPTATVSSVASGQICSGVAQNYTITSATTGATFIWNRPAFAGISNAAVSNQTSSSITETLNNATASPVNVAYTITPSFNGCEGTPFNYVLRVNPSPTVTITYTQDSECRTDSVSFLSTASPFVTSYQWNFGDGSNSSLPKPKHLYSAGGTYTVTLTVSTASNCTGSDNDIVTVANILAAPVITATPSTNNVKFSWQPVTGAVSYQISVDGGITFIPPNGPNNLSHTVSGLAPLQPANIVVQAMGQFVCQTSSNVASSAAVLPDLQLFVPNTITPNGDGKNDKLKVLANYMTAFDMHIFNQWGQQIWSYKGTDVTMGWDGTMNGTAQPAGVYVYTVTVTMKDGRRINQKGMFNVIR